VKFRLSHLPQIITDAVILTASLYISFLLHFNFSIPDSEWQIFKNTFFIIVIIKLFVFFVSGLYDRMWRYVSTRELRVLVIDVAIGSALAVIPLYFISQTGFSRAVIIVDALLSVLLVGGARFSVRYIYELQKHRSVMAESKPALIFGAGDSGEVIVREMLKHPEVKYDPVGFVDDDPAKQGRRIHGVQVLGTHKDILRIAAKHEIEELVIAIPTAPSSVIRDAVALCDEAGIKCKTLPGVFELIDGTVDLNQIRDINVEDLLGREPVKIDVAEAKAYLNGAVVLVTGGAGSIGSELCRQIIRFEPKKLIIFDHNENDTYYLLLELKEKYPDLDLNVIIGDIKDMALLEHVFKKERPDVVFHAAAHKHVPLMQENIVAAVGNNVTGSKNLMRAAEKFNVKRFVLISTDKAVDPTGIMGTTKRIAEMILQSRFKHTDADTKFMAVRFGNVIGSNGSVAPIFMKQIEAGGPVKVTHPEATRYFMSTSEAVKLVLQAGAIGKGGEVFLLDMGEPVKIIDLARNLIRLSGLRPDVDIKIEFMGLRPGEAITEDLVGTTETVAKTKQDKVLAVQDGGFDYEKFLTELDALEKMASKYQVEQVDEQMHKMVPTYKRSESSEITKSARSTTSTRSV
jgi:FlaA1/EpsC-like NDP-sugar epimerase